MKSVVNKFSLTVFRKIVMSVTGILMVVFLITHLAGNLLMLFGKDLYNEYSHVLLHIPVIIPALEIGLVVILLIHIYEALATKKKSLDARPVGYQAPKHWAKEKRADQDNTKTHKSWSSVLMIGTGIIIAVFVVLHVWMFKYGTHYSYTPGGGTAIAQATGDGLQTAAAPLQIAPRAEIRDLFKLVRLNFKNPIIVVLYLLAMIALGSHLYHAVWSTSQTLGATNNKVRQSMVWIGKATAIVLAAGFFILPLWVFFFVP